MNELIFNDILKLKTENSSLTTEFFSFYKATPLSTQRKGWPIRKRKRVLCLSIYIIIFPRQR